MTENATRSQLRQETDRQTGQIDGQSKYEIKKESLRETGYVSEGLYYKRDGNGGARRKETATTGNVLADRLTLADSVKIKDLHPLSGRVLARNGRTKFREIPSDRDLDESTPNKRKSS